MVALINLLQPLLQNVRIDLRGRNLTVPEHKLDRAQISSPFEKMRGKRVPDQMRRQGNRKACLTPVAGQDLPKPHARQGLSLAVEKQEGLVPVLAQARAAVLPIGFHGSQS